MAIEQEYRAARDGCAVYAADARRLVAASGEDRVTFLHGMLSHDVKALRSGSGTFAALLTQQGKIVSDLRVYADDDCLLLDAPAARAPAVMEALEKFIVADDVALSLPAEQPLVGLSGPLCATVLHRVLGTDLPRRTPLSHQRYPFAATRVRVVAVDAIDGPGYMLCGLPPALDDLRQALQGAGAAPIGIETLNVLRVEAGIPWYGVDMDDDILLMETNLERAVSFTKGCYLGQEVVERVAARGKVNKKLSGLRLAGDDVPAAGTVLRSGEREVGRITSAVRSPALRQVVALGYVHRDFLEPGTVLTAAATSGAVQATVSALPFVAPPADPSIS